MHGITRKDRNLTFRPVQYLRVGKALGLQQEKSLFDPDTRLQVLVRRLGLLKVVPDGAWADRERAHLLGTGPKVAAAAQLTARLERIVAEQWGRPLDELVAALHAYRGEPLPEGYVGEFARMGEINPADSYLAEALSRLSLAPAEDAVPIVPAAPAGPVVDDLTAVLRMFTQLTLDAEPGPGTAAERGGLADYPELAGAPGSVR